MTQVLDVVNRALQLAGTRTNVSATEWAALSSNEAIQANLVIYKLRDQLNRMAPWDCVTKYANLTYITSQPLTPENTPSSNPPQWQPGVPAPPWVYEYQYPVDCMRARKVIPNFTALAGGVPIYPPGVATGSAGIGYTGPPLKFKVATDSFYAVTAAAVQNAGANYNLGDLIFLPQPTFTFTQNYPPLGPALMGSQTFTMNVGAPAVLQVTSVGAGGVIGSVAPVNQVYDENVSPSGATTQVLSGSYFQQVIGNISQNFATGANGEVSNGTGAAFSLTFTGPNPQRVILCNQEMPLLCYNAAVIDPNVMDGLYLDAWQHILGARLAFQLSGDKGTANLLIGLTNGMIAEARKADGNEGITVNDVMPDWLRARGSYGVGPDWAFSPNQSFDWGGWYSPY